MRLRKKPVEIDGFQMTAERMRLRSVMDWPEWALAAASTPPDTAGALCQTDDVTWYVQTLDGNVRVRVDDWILRGVKGELYPCRPDIVALTYDIIGPDQEGT